MPRPQTPVRAITDVAVVRDRGERGQSTAAISSAEAKGGLYQESRSFFRGELFDFVLDRPKNKSMFLT